MTTPIRADIFPTTATLTASDGAVQVFDRARIILTGETPNRVFIFKDGAHGPEQRYVSEAFSYDPPHTPQRLREAWAPAFTTYTIEVPDATLTFGKPSGCGCGSRLKSFNPFPSINSLNAS